MSRTEIVSVIGRQVLDSRGNPTVEAEVQLSGGVACTAISPSGASTGSREALELRDGDMQLYGGKSVLQACKNISGAIHNALRGMDADNLFAVDQALIALDGTKNKAVLGANATLAVSMACAKAAACAQGVALFRFLGGTEAVDRYISLGVPFGIVDLSLAPTPAVGDSVAHILEEMGLESCGIHGTTAALALLNDAVKKGGVMASSYVGGLSGAFIPVSEDQGMIDAARDKTLTIEKLEAMTCVCSVGLDMIVIPGDTSPEVISAIIADEAAIGMVNCKTTAVRVIPTIGKDVGDELCFGGLLGSGPVMKLNDEKKPNKFIERAGRIPAPMHSLKN